VTKRLYVGYYALLFSLSLSLSLSLFPEDKMEKKKNKKLQALGLDLYYNYKF